MFHHRLALTVCFFVVIFAGFSAHAALFHPKIHTLSNGMDVVVIEDHRAPVVSHMIWYKVGAADEPPAPVLHSPPRKVTAADQAAWTIPPALSNWKNTRGFTVPLDKRLAADGRGLQETAINDNFAKVAQALYIAESAARDEVAQRAAIQKKLAINEKEQHEESLRQLAQQAV